MNQRRFDFSWVQNTLSKGWPEGFAPIFVMVFSLAAGFYLAGVAVILAESAGLLAMVLLMLVLFVFGGFFRPKVSHSKTRLIFATVLVGIFVGSVLPLITNFDNALVDFLKP